MKMLDVVASKSLLNKINNTDPNMNKSLHTLQKTLKSFDRKLQLLRILIDLTY